MLKLQATKTQQLRASLAVTMFEGFRFAVKRTRLRVHECLWIQGLVLTAKCLVFMGALSFNSKSLALNYLDTLEAGKTLHPKP